jgi:ribosome-binding protein aMBF1 (putative translation factor)
LQNITTITNFKQQGGAILPTTKQKEDIKMGKMRVLTDKAIRKHYDGCAKNIKDMAMPETRDRLLKSNEEEMEKCLKILKRDGFVEVEFHGRQWIVKDYFSRLKFHREDKGMSQRQLSEASGVNVRTIQNFEQGRKDINSAGVVTVLSLAEALDVDVYDIINPRN